MVIGSTGRILQYFGKPFLSFIYVGRSRNTCIQSWKLRDTTTREESGLVAVPTFCTCLTVTLAVCKIVLEPIAKPRHTQVRKLFGIKTMIFFMELVRSFTDLVGWAV